MWVVYKYISKDMVFNQRDMLKQPYMLKILVKLVNVTGEVLE